MLHDQEISGLFITSSRLAFEDLIEHAQEAEMICNFETTPKLPDSEVQMQKWRRSFIRKLEILAKDTWPASTEKLLKPFEVKDTGRRVELTLYLIPGERPRDVFSPGVKYNLPEIQKNNKLKYKNTLIGLLELSHA